MKTREELTREVFKGDEARRVFEHPLIKRFMDEMRADVFHNLRTSHWKDAEEREELYKMIKAIDMLEDKFNREVSAGKKAKTLLEKLFNKGE